MEVVHQAYVLSTDYDVLRVLLHIVGLLRQPTSRASGDLPAADKLDYVTHDFAYHVFSIRRGK